MYEEEDYLMLSGIQHFAFCRRQWALIHIEQQWAENYRTTSGELFHKNAHNEKFFERRGNIITAHGIRIASAELGISGQCDVVEFCYAEDGITLKGYDGKWNIVPVEYKRGSPKSGNEDVLQLCAQAMCLEEMFLVKIEEGYLFYGENRRRQKVTFSLELREQVEKFCREMHQLFKRGFTPIVKMSKKCKACSLVDICLPKIQNTKSVSTYIHSRLIEEVSEK